ncbi:MAG TPA: hypothetical protein VMG82_01330 [Candidatus Sulfotelmatobacter sp.]|nr:hypothetical protein [Candidatus Sulfotelmatobacter sp.]
MALRLAEVGDFVAGHVIRLLNRTDRPFVGNLQILPYLFPAI